MVLHILMTILLLMIAVTDAKTMEIPDEFIAAMGILAILSIWFIPEITWKDRIIGAFCISVPMYALCILIKDAFGGGDIKLVFVMGFYLGWKQVLTGMFLAVLFGGVQAIYLMIGKNVKAGENAHMAFGPALCLGMTIALFWGNALISRYFEWFC